MKLPELKEKLKSKYIVRVVAGVLTIALVGTGIGATAVFAEKNSSTAVTAEADSTTGSSKDADDIADKLMDSVSLKDNDADKDESVYLISDANGNVNKTIVVDHLKNKDKKDTLEDASNLSDIENVKGKEKFTQSGDKLTWQAGGKDIYYQGTATEEPPVTQKVTYYLDGKEISPEDLAGKSGKVKIRFDYTNTTSYTETVNGEKQTVSVPFAAITGLVLGDGFENIEVTNGKAEVSDSSSVVLGYALPGLKNSLGIKDKDLDGDVNIPEYMEMTADVENFSMPAAMTFVVNASDYVSTDGIDTSDIDVMINDLKDASTQLQDGSKTLAEGTDTLSDGLSTLQSKLGRFQHQDQHRKDVEKRHTAQNHERGHASAAVNVLDERHAQHGGAAAVARLHELAHQRLVLQKTFSPRPDGQDADEGGGKAEQHKPGPEVVQDVHAAHVQKQHERQSHLKGQPVRRLAERGRQKAELPQRVPHHHDKEHRQGRVQAEN